MFCAGMVGNYNGDQTDDVVYRDGTMVPLSEFSFRLLHQVGLSCELLTLHEYSTTACLSMLKYLNVHCLC